MATRDEILAVVAVRYRGATRADKARMLDEFTAVTGFHRKHAMRVLRAHGVETAVTGMPRMVRRRYDDGVREALVLVWEASDRICGKRLKVLLPTLVAAMEQHGHLTLDPAVRVGLLAMSAATIDRVLGPVKSEAGRQRRRRSIGSTALRRSVPVRTFSDWNDPLPGFVEADLVAHCGSTTRGSFLYTLVLTDVATGWTECAPLLVREQTLLRSVLGELRKLMPFDLLGFDTDNDSVFLNETIRDYCRDEGILFTRCRPYRKNDQAHVEQKNGAVVRRIVGYRRLEGLEAGRVLAELYATTRLFVNVFQPSFKLADKTRDGAKVTKRYHPPAAPCDRLIGDVRTTEAAREQTRVLKADLDPVRLLARMRQLQGDLVALADKGFASHSPNEATSIDVFLSGLRTAWTKGEVRPTAVPKPKVPRGRRRPDPLKAVTGDLEAWFAAEPTQTARELLERIQSHHPGQYSDKVLRTLQRRLQAWRRTMIPAAMRVGPILPRTGQGAAPSTTSDPRSPDALDAVDNGDGETPPPLPTAAADDDAADHIACREMV